jgi:hypothetical protein
MIKQQRGANIAAGGCISSDPGRLTPAGARAPEPLGPVGIEDLPWLPMQKLTTDR